MTDSSRNAFTEKRQFSRLSLPLQVYINSEKDNGDRLHNISEGGVCFQSFHSFSTDDFIFFHFRGDENTDIEGMEFAIPGKIIWYEGKNSSQTKYGAQFAFLNDPFSKQQRTKIKSVIDRYNSNK